jgi:putative endonuclease
MRLVERISMGRRLAYILRCADGSYYTGTTRDTLETRVAQHEAGAFDGYTSDKRPVKLVYSEHFQRVVDACHGAPD